MYNNDNNGGISLESNTMSWLLLYRTKWRRLISPLPGDIWLTALIGFNTERLPTRGLEILRRPNRRRPIHRVMMATNATMITTLTLPQNQTLFSCYTRGLLSARTSKRENGLAWLFVPRKRPFEELFQFAEKEHVIGNQWALTTGHTENWKAAGI